MYSHNILCHVVGRRMNSDDYEKFLQNTTFYLSVCLSVYRDDLLNPSTRVCCLPRGSNNCVVRLLCNHGHVKMFEYDFEDSIEKEEHEKVLRL